MKLTEQLIAKIKMQLNLLNLHLLWVIMQTVVTVLAVVAAIIVAVTAVVVHAQVLAHMAVVKT